MKRTPLLFAALVPFVAMAEGDRQADVRVDSEKLRKAVPATALLSEEVLTKKGEEVGEIEDIIVKRNGDVRHFLVDADLSELEGGEARLDRDKGITEEGEWSDERVAAEAEEAANDVEDFGRDVGEEIDTANVDSAEDWSENRREADRAIDWMGEEFTPVKPRSIRYNEAEGELVVEADALTANAQEAGDSPQGMRVSEIIGMEVDLQDEDSFGRVEDVMLSDDGAEIAALVVDNWDGLDKERRALPIEDATFRYDEEEVTFSYTEDQVENASEFNLDDYDAENGWDVDVL